MSVAISAEETRERCAALTHAGAPCKNYPLPDSLYCRAHQPNEEDRPPRQRPLPQMALQATPRPHLSQKTSHLKRRCGIS